MTLNPPAAKPTRPQAAQAAVRRTFARYEQTVLLIAGIVLGFVLSRL